MASRKQLAVALLVDGPGERVCWQSLTVWKVCFEGVSKLVYVDGCSFTLDCGSLKLSVRHNWEVGCNCATASASMAGGLKSINHNPS